MIISIHNAATNETIEREATDEEIAQFAADEKFVADIKKEYETKRLAALEKLAAIGLTEFDLSVFGI